MSDSTAVYIVSGSPDWTDAVSEAMDGISGTFGSTEELVAAGVTPGGGVLLLGPGVGEDEVAAVGRTLGAHGAAWSVFRGREAGEDGGIDVVPVPIPGSCAIALTDLARRLRGDGGEPPPLELCEVLTFVARARHDINNPLTSALAETQLLLLDVEDPETRSGLETVEAQLRRIRDLVARLQVLPRPRSGDGAPGARGGGA